MNRLLIPCLLLPLFGCPPARGDLPLDDDDDAGGDDDDAAFSAGWSFGECGGECLGELSLSDAGLTYTISGWGGEVYWLQDSPGLTASGDVLLNGALDATPVAELEPVYGCPDCADGGASWVEFLIDGAAARTTYENGRPPVALEALDAALRSIYWDFDSCGFEYIEQFACESRVVIGR